MLNFVDMMYEKGNRRTGFMKHYYTLFSIVQGLEAKRTFEFGTGMSTWAICAALAITSPSAAHISCDLRELKGTGLPIDFPSQFPNWTFNQADSRVVSREVEGPFDFVLHDGSHETDIVTEDLQNIIPKMKSNSILLVHDTKSVNFGEALLGAVKSALDDVEYELLTLPYGYGLTIVKILDNESVGVVKPTWVKQSQHA